MLRKLAFALAFVFVALIAAAVIVPRVIPEPQLRAWVQTQASQALGRQVTVAGPVSVSILPKIQARAEAVTIANAPGFTGAPLAEVEALRVAVKVAPLITGSVVVDEFILVRPALSLEAKPDGQVNWALGAADVAGEPQAGAASAGFERTPGGFGLNAALGAVRVENGSGTYRGPDGATQTLADVTVSASLPALDGPLTLDGGLSFDGQPMSIQARLDSVKGFLDGLETPVRITADSPVLELSVDGAFTESRDIAFTGDVDLVVPSVRDLVAFGGAQLPDGAVYGRAEIKGRASGSPERIAFENAKVRLDDLRADGAVTLDLSGAKPKLTGAVTTGPLNLTPYAPAAPDGGNTGSSGVAADWSGEPLDLSVVNAMDADLTLTVDSLEFGDLAFGRGDVRAQVQDGRLSAELVNLTAYDGAVSGTLVANARSARPSFSLDVAMRDVQAQPLLGAVSTFNRITGQGDVRMAFQASGGSVQAIMASLAGDGGFDFANGALLGVNLAEAATSLEDAARGNVNLAAFGRGKSTSFRTFGAPFTAENGRITTTALTLTSGDFALTGQGILDLGGRSASVTLPITVRQADAAALAGATIPVQIAVDWGNAPRIGVDTDALAAQASDRAEDALRDLARDALGDSDEPVADILRGLLDD